MDSEVLSSTPSVSTPASVCRNPHLTMVSRVTRNPSLVVSTVHGSASLARLPWLLSCSQRSMSASSGAPWLWVSYSEGRIKIPELMGTASLLTWPPCSHSRWALSCCSARPNMPFLCWGLFLPVNAELISEAHHSRQPFPLK